jgi:pSer/pThr/pTyr-binding forkhead associated (FHA) protein
MLPQIALRFEGTDSGGHKCSFDVALDRLVGRPEGMVIGRSADQSELVVPHPTVSRRHARLVVAGEALKVEDLGSTNGTAVNGAAVVAGTPAVLQAGSRLRIGDVELFVRQV